MTTAADKIKANAERLRQKTPAKPTGAEEPAAGDPSPARARSSRGAVAVRQENVRRTVDLSPAAHDALDDWQRATRRRLGLARVTGQDVLASLVDELLADDELSERITQRVTQRVTQRAIAANRD